MRLAMIASISLALGWLALPTGCDSSEDNSSSSSSSTSGSTSSGEGGAGGSGAGIATGGSGGGGNGCSCDIETYSAEAMAGEQLFDGVQETTATPIADILASLSSYEGQLVRIEGFIVEICQTQGCYVTLDDCFGNHLNLKVTDGVLDFREYVELGQYAIGEGLVMASGEHGAQVYIQDYGAMLGSTVCPEFAGN